MINSKSRLAMVLSQLKVFDDPSPHEEQYPMDSETGAEVLWNASFNGDIEGKSVADLGAGTGILGIGALLLQAKNVYFVEQDPKAIAILRENLQEIEQKDAAVVAEQEVGTFETPVDTIIQNPPFGTKQKHADREFLLKAFALAPVIYSFHKATSRDFIERIAMDQGYAVTHYYAFDFPIKASMLFHKKAIHRIKVGCWRLARNAVQQKEEQQEN